MSTTTTGEDGSYEYYLSEKVVTNDPKGVGAFLKASVDLETAARPKPGRGRPAWSCRASASCRSTA